ncbi:hypothetical protein DMH02_004905 [Streptomyces sp. WAC 00631]|uniref:hypothetical protein n=1 Tax=unclassified Streptomyces TaxID=2593676 RepID=UPI000F78DCB2|nr:MULTISPECIES: hypothetical protein [unclassified Streptomyces]MCC5032605.1 hypothetical protein [Streptomyces sp. WAC 00631]MCC9740699.1 hypothetical protein [Streptomyces sp. MNU89]
MISSNAAHRRRLAAGAVTGALMAVLAALLCLPGRAAPAAAPGGGGTAAMAQGFPVADRSPVPAEEPADAEPEAGQPSGRAFAGPGTTGPAEAAPTWSADDDGSSNCKRPQDRGTGAAVPATAASAHDQCPALGARPAYAEGDASEAVRGLPAVRGPTGGPATPVTLSVLLRV